MPEWLRYILVLGMAVWCIWYFSRVLWIALTTGRLIDSRPWDGVPVTRESKPIAFWFSVGLGLLFLPAFLWFAASVVGHMVGLWEFVF
ncbi:MAG: hypothetical protein ABL864_00480 [Terricaulis sp.]